MMVLGDALKFKDKVLAKKANSYFIKNKNKLHFKFKLKYMSLHNLYLDYLWENGFIYVDFLKSIHHKIYLILNYKNKSHVRK